MKNVLTIRATSGLSGDMILTGLSLMQAESPGADAHLASPQNFERHHAHKHENEDEHSHEHSHDHHAHPQAYYNHKHDHKHAGSNLDSQGRSHLFQVHEAPELENLQSVLEEIIASLKLPALEQGQVFLERRSLNNVGGWGCRMALPHEHVHRNFSDMVQIIESSALDPEAVSLARKAFSLVASAEAKVHGLPLEEVCFHEVGALDSILDICVSCALYVRLGSPLLVCSPLPLGDGGVFCAHGWLPVPAPAVLELLHSVPVCGFAGEGESVTPTAVALLKALGATFGPWPDMMVERRALVYGGKVFAKVPNGSVWAFGQSCHE